MNRDHDNPYEYDFYEDAFGDDFGENAPFGVRGGYPGNREYHLYSSLMRQGKFAEADKAKHNEQYRKFLLENFEDDF